MRSPYLGPECGTRIDYQLYHYVWNRSETERIKFKIAPHKQKPIVKKILAGRCPHPTGQRGPVHS